MKNDNSKEKHNRYIFLLLCITVKQRLNVYNKSLIFTQISL